MLTFLNVYLAKRHSKKVQLPEQFQSDYHMYTYTSRCNIVSFLCSLPATHAVILMIPSEALSKWFDG